MAHSEKARRLLRVPEVCSILGVSRTTLYTMLARAELPTIKVGDARTGVRIPSDAVDAWMERQIQASSFEAA
ncbi:MAG TPA: helix-turn-helix domain-containing protein [Chloroflexota bacterium]|nr:helix-turn-helix domain-containing protein [Chloroflexota bacterium]